MNEVAVVIDPEPVPPALEGDNYTVSNPQAVKASPIRAEKDTEHLKPDPQEPLNTRHALRVKWLWIVGFLLACGWIYSVI